MADDPWKGLTPRPTEGEISARRVDAYGPWDFFWGLDTSGAYLFLLQHTATLPVSQRLPRLQGIHLSELRPPGKAAVLAFRLEEPAHRDIFERLCRDIVDHCADAVSETDAMQTAISRTWRWHHLLRGGGDERLSREEQKGLIGELLTLERLILPNLDVGDGVMAWVGPLDAPKDFDFGRVAVEAKAHSTGGAPAVTVSSEHQLDSGGLETLFLYVVDVAPAQASSGDGFTVSEFATRIRALVGEAAPAVLDHFDSLLTAAGLRMDDDYTDARWAAGLGRLFDVRPGFPRITSSVPAGVSRVRYTLSLIECEPFLTTEESLRKSLQSGGLRVERA